MPPVAVIPRRTPRCSPRKTPGEANSPGNVWRRVRVIWIPGIINRRRVGWHVDNRRTGGRYFDDLLRDLRNLRDIRLVHDNICYINDLLLGRLEIPHLFGFGAKRLDRIHHILRLVNERLAEIHRPRQVRIHLSDQFRKLRDGFHVVVPVLLIHLCHIIRVLHETRRLDDLHRVSCGRQHDRNERIGVQRDRLTKFFEIRRALLRRGRGWCCRILINGVRLRSGSADDDNAHYGQ